MDRRSFCKVLGFAAGSTLLPGLMVQAAGQGSVGHAVPDGRYTIGIRSDLSGCDLTHAFYYSDSFFTHPATQYDHQLALATLGLVCAAANTVASDAEYWVNGSVGREAHIAAAYETLGFEDALFYNYDLDTGRAGDFVGYSLARKTLTLNGQRTTLVALVLRGGGYGGEWASNFHIGDTSAHTGFVTPVAAVFASLKAYLARAGQCLQALAGRLQPRFHHCKSAGGKDRPGAAPAGAGEHLCLRLCGACSPDCRRPT